MLVPLSWLKTFLETNKNANELARALTMAGVEVESVTKVGSDSVLEIAITPNRSDCLSLMGVAQELSAVSDGKLKNFKPRTSAGKGSKISSQLKVKIAESDCCPRYMARKIDGVKIAPSPKNIQAHLEAAGFRPINNVVDATNYVMLELGNPLHAFDARFVTGGEITIKRAGKTVNKFTTLDNSEWKISPDDLLICDAKGPIALAGIMGGQNSEVRDDTTSLIIEAAYFEPLTVRRTAKRLGLTSESSRRFERGVDPTRVELALHRVVELICEWAGGEPTVDWIDCYPKKIKQTKITLMLSEIERVLGVSIAPNRAKSWLSKLGCNVEAGKKPDSIIVTVPTARPDLTRPIDLIEEIARLHGYDNIEIELPSATPSGLFRPADYDLRKNVRERLAGLGFAQVLHYSFEACSVDDKFAWPAAKPAMLDNPLGGEPTRLKTTLSAGLVDAAALNQRNGQPNIRLLEQRPVFALQGKKVVQEQHIAGIIVGSRTPESWTNPQIMLDFYDVKGVVEGLLETCSVAGVSWSQEGDLPAFLHPGRSAWVLSSKGDKLGVLGELHPELVRKYDFASPPQIFELSWEKLAASKKQATSRYKKVVRHPAIRRDIALLMEETLPSEKIVATISGYGEKWIHNISIFDVYKGDKLPSGKKSVAFAIIYQDPARTLTDEEVNTAHARVVEKLTVQHDVEIRK